MTIGSFVFVKTGVQRTSHKTGKVTLKGGDRVKVISIEKDYIVIEKGTKRFALKEDEVVS